MIWSSFFKKIHVGTKILSRSLDHWKKRRHSHVKFCFFDFFTFLSNFLHYYRFFLHFFVTFSPAQTCSECVSISNSCIWYNGDSKMGCFTLFKETQILYESGIDKVSWGTCRIPFLAIFYAITSFGKFIHCRVGRGVKRPPFWLPIARFLPFSDFENMAKHIIYGTIFFMGIMAHKLWDKIARPQFRAILCVR